ncbi:MAG: ferrous iron transporter B [Methanothrix sp.]|uniref:ferrous iron transporter B n=1 Tax=Methanothrix sp. TaxID=90426 RepID=UPI0025D880A6|nr:ferrous iron transporter B [Methanothrix sp.]MCQ8903337.1 ferrous iron transporter B [Methanothrix sp.]
MQEERPLKILLMGNPNVGKSIIFSRLTGADAISSNYPGTTVGYTEGSINVLGRSATLIDVPGVYSLEPSSKAEEVANLILDQGADLIVNVVDATNLERNLNLTLELQERGIPMVVALNLWDVAVRKGLEIDVKMLSEELGIKVVPTVASSGLGIRDLVEAIGSSMGSRPPALSLDPTERWQRVGEIVSRVQKVHHRHPSHLERLEDLTIRPWTGIPVAITVLYLSFSLIVGAGELLMERVSDPLFLRYSYWIFAIADRYTSGFAHDILVGRSPELLESFGLLTTGLYIPFGIVLPFLIPFYLVLGFLEDLGYLPRVSVLMDALMHRLGLHGAAIIPCVLGMGCSVPGVLGLRVLESPKQRFLAATLMTMSIPCASQTAMVFGILAPYGLRYIFAVYATLLAVFIISGMVLHRMIREESPEIFMEIPQYRMPVFGALVKKTFLRIRTFILEAVPYIGIGIVVMNVFELTGLMRSIGELASPIVSGVLGLPEGAATALILGFLRKDIGIGMFVPLGLSPEQLVIAAVVLAMYFPCVATLTVLMKELGAYDTIRAVVFRLVAAAIVGGVLRVILL